MAFDSYSAKGSDTSTESPRKEVDYEAMNKYLVETANLENREVLVGYVSAIVDLGTQAQEDAEVVFNGKPEDEAGEIEKHPNTYFKDGYDQQTKKQARFKCWPQKPIQSVAVAVDFPDILVDKGQFFGESNPLPLRLWLGNQFYLQGKGMVVGRPTPLKINKAMGFWSFDQKHLLYKMAVGAKLIKPGEAFMPQDIDKLLGVSLQFEAQVFFKENKGKQYLTEYVKYVSGLGRGQKDCELVVKPVLVQFNQPNADEALKSIRNHVINTIKMAENYEDSEIKKQLEKLGIGASKPAQEAPEGDDSQAQEETPVEAVAAPAKGKVPKKAATTVATSVAPPVGDIDDSDPF